MGFSAAFLNSILFTIGWIFCEKIYNLIETLNVALCIYLVNDIIIDDLDILGLTAADDRRWVRPVSTVRVVNWSVWHCSAPAAFRWAFRD